MKHLRGKRDQGWKSLSTFMITVLCMGSLVTILIWHNFDDSNWKIYRPPLQKKSAPKLSDLCKRCKKVIDSIKNRYSQPWKKQEENYHRLRLQLNIDCNASNNAIITPDNTPMGSTIICEQDRTNVQVTPEIFKIFTKENPFSKKIWNTCSVVGNSGILTNSGCGKKIDSADFVIRCNLPPVENGFELDVGSKTDLVTANPSIFNEQYESLMGRRRPLVESLKQYGNSLLLLPCFSYGVTVPVCRRAAYAIEDMKSSIRPIFLNPQYHENLENFWRSKGLKEMRLTTGLIMVSLALELCENVHLYGFWPFSNHIYDLYALTNHYFNDKLANNRIHKMPAEFDHWLQLHSQGVLRLHLGKCKPGE